jgi:hypothetical protein
LLNPASVGGYCKAAIGGRPSVHENRGRRNVFRLIHRHRGTVGGDARPVQIQLPEAAAYGNGAAATFIPEM